LRGQAPERLVLRDPVQVQVRPEQAQVRPERAQRVPQEQVRLQEA